MSYNGIGLKTAKGSSTSGHIQQSLAHNNEGKNMRNFLSRVEKKNKPHKRAPPRKQESMILHLSKREIELRVSEYRDRLEDDDTLTDDVIDSRCIEYRKKLLLEQEQSKKDERLRTAYVSRKARDCREHASDQEERNGDRKSGARNFKSTREDLNSS
ncbi:LAFE_0G13102g1_1 [Lachancea fermentati]|uniref:Pre-mRNA-splicing factor CWC21 n=1 Tax=Lachancea fermentati TaxID=4955 RepID=A0A1G4MI29_LACFM|nr:LAFE_0G13102g1_1 [Lachancea fermentati]